MGLAETCGEIAGETVLMKQEFQCAVIFPYVRKLFMFRLGSKERMGTVIH